MNIMITGGAGFIGSHLAQRALADGHSVIIVDDLSTARSKNDEPLNLAHLFSNPRLSFVHHDIINHIAVAAPVDAIFHLASFPSPVDYLRNPIRTLKVGAIGTLNVLGLARAKGARFLLASTSEVYGDPDPRRHPQDEAYCGNVNPVGPRGSYDESKRFAEAMTMAYHRNHGVDTRIARIFNTYGPRMRHDDGRVIPTMALQALRREPLAIHGDDGHQTRSFCYCDDLVEGLYLLLTRSDERMPVNLGTDNEVSIRDLAELINRLTGSSAGLAFQPDRRIEGDPQRRCPDISKAQRVLGWKPTTPLEKGLKQTLAYFDSQLHGGA